MYTPSSMLHGSLAHASMPSPLVPERYLDRFIRFFTARRYNSAVYGVVRPYTVRLSVRLSQAEMNESSWVLARGLKTTKIMATDKVIQQPYCCTSVAYLQKYGLQQKPGVAIFLPTPTCIAL